MYGFSTWQMGRSTAFSATYLCMQERLRSAEASAQFDQSLPWPHEHSLAVQRAPRENLVWHRMFLRQND